MTNAVLTSEGLFTVEMVIIKQRSVLEYSLTLVFLLVVTRSCVVDCTIILEAGPSMGL